MADQKLTQLTPESTIADTDLWYFVDDPGGSPLSRSTTSANLATYIKSKNLAGTDNRIPRFDTPNGVQDSDWQITDAGVLEPITNGNNFGNGTERVGDAYINTIKFDSSVTNTVADDANSNAEIKFGVGTDEILLTASGGNDLDVLSAKSGQVYGSATDFATVDGAYHLVDRNKFFVSWYDFSAGKDNYFKIDGNESGVGHVELNVKFSASGSTRNGEEYGVYDNIGADRTSSTNDAFPVLISTNNSTIRSNVTNSVGLGGVALDVDTDDTVFIPNLNIQDGKNVVLDTTTGTQFGTATGQKLAFFGSTPIIQQTTTSQTAAAFVANTSGIADDTATWGGYTVGDIVAILQAFGLLA